MQKEKAWDEKEEFEGDFDIVKEENDDGTVSFVTRKVTSCKFIILRTESLFCNGNICFLRNYYS